MQTMFRILAKGRRPKTEQRGINAGMCTSSDKAALYKKMLLLL